VPLPVRHVGDTHDPARRRRLSADARRREIVEHAADVFVRLGAERATTADVAHAAGVTRALVHHHFGGIDEVYAALVRYEAERFAPPEPVRGGTLEARVERDVAARLDAIKAHADLWLATAGNPFPPNDPRVCAALEAGVDESVERLLDAYGDVLRDTRDNRAALRAYVRFADGTTREWLTGHTSRVFAGRLVASTLRHLLEDLPAR
jgi:AcrR family transcriptional regulator